MPAARPSKASICNAVSGLVEAGFQPASLQVAADGSFRIDFVDGLNSAALVTPQEIGDDCEVLAWEDVQ